MVVSARAEAQDGADTHANPTADPSAVVIELLVDAGDTISLRGAPYSENMTYPLAEITEDTLVLDPLVVSALSRRDADFPLRLADNVRELADVAVVVVERRRYLGEMRRGDATVIWLQPGLPPFPIADRPDLVLMTPVGSEPPLFELIQWPEAMWKLDDSERDSPVLEIDSDDGVAELAAGDETVLMSADWQLPLRLARFEPVKVGDSSNELKPVEIDLGEATFSTEVTIRFHGRLAIRIAK
ncbi:MAG: hypothetical protein GY791_03520 [Alphaproteobacteria bacterium]|nr:hypothetical protein [Alphaproteobacteria bacterium]